MNLDGKYENKIIFKYITYESKERNWNYGREGQNQGCSSLFI
jgi:hypothetical protein